MVRVNPGLADRKKGEMIAEKRRNLVAELNDNGFLGNKALAPKANQWICVKRIALSGGDLVVTRYTWGEKKTTLPFPVSDFAKGYSCFFAVKLQRHSPCALGILVIHDCWVLMVGTDQGVGLTRNDQSRREFKSARSQLVGGDSWR